LVTLTSSENETSKTDTCYLTTNNADTVQLQGCMCIPNHDQIMIRPAPIVAVCDAALRLYVTSEKRDSVRPTLMRNQGWTHVNHLSSIEMLLNEQKEIDESIEDLPVEFPQSQARASEVIPTQVLQGTR